MNTHLIDEVLKVSNSKNYDVLSLLYKRIFNFLLHRNRSINEGINDLPNYSEGSEFGLEKEVAAALESVIPRAVLSPFILLNNTEKVTQLTELFNLVIGIRLFNKEIGNFLHFICFFIIKQFKIGKGGVTLASVDELIDNKGHELRDKIQERINEQISLSEDYANYFMYKKVVEGKTDFPDSEKKKKEITFLRQHLVFILNLQEKIEETENIIESNEGRYLKEISDLKNLLGSKSSAPKEQVYPKFAVLAASYLELLEEKKQMNHKMELFNILEASYKSVKLSLTEATSRMTRNWMDSYVVLAESFNFEIQPNSGVVYIEPAHSPDYFQNPIDFFGFCIVTLVENDGLLVPGKHEMGIFKYQDKMLLFKGKEQADIFLRNPSLAIESFYVMCRKRPELIFLLRYLLYFFYKRSKIKEFF